MDLPCGIACDGVYSAPAGVGAGGCDVIEAACQGHIDWAMQTGINTNPEWYPNLTPTSPIEHFQCELAQNDNVPDCQAVPCGLDCASIGTPPACSTAQAGDPCFGHVDWAMNNGIHSNPEWYPLLHATSTFEEFQCEIVLGGNNAPDCVDLPCGIACDGVYSAPANPPANAVCDVPEAVCQGHLDWAMNTGINSNPEWYPNLTPTSPIEHFQCELAANTNVPDCNVLPCGVDCSTIGTPPACATTVAGDACFGHVEWAMQTGINTNPEWYPLLHATSTFEEFQCEIVLGGNNPAVCPTLPCGIACDGAYSAPAGGGDG